MKKYQFNVYVPVQDGSRKERKEIENQLEQLVAGINGEVIFVETFDTESDSEKYASKSTS